MIGWMKTYAISIIVYDWWNEKLGDWLTDIYSNIIIAN